MGRQLEKTGLPFDGFGLVICLSMSILALLLISAALANPIQPKKNIRSSKTCLGNEKSEFSNLPEPNICVQISDHAMDLPLEPLVIELVSDDQWIISWSSRDIPLPEAGNPNLDELRQLVGMQCETDKLFHAVIRVHDNVKFESTYKVIEAIRKCADEHDVRSQVSYIPVGAN